MTTNLHRLTVFCFIFTLIGLSACSSHSDVLPQSSHFASKITQDDSKRFTYTITLTNDRREQSQSKRLGQLTDEPTNIRDSGYASVEQGQQIREQLLKGLQQELEANGFCREGYFELDYTFFATQAQLRGECQESANITDKKRW